MGDSDFSKLNGQLAQSFTPGGSSAAATSHQLKNISHWAPAADCAFSYDTGDFDVAVDIAKNAVIGVPDGAKSLTLTPATAIMYMRKNQANG